MRIPAAALVLIACLTATSAAQDSKDTFVSKSLGVSIEPPAVQGSAGYLVAAFSTPLQDGFSANVNVQRQEFRQSIDAYDELTKAQFVQAGFTVVKRERRGEREIVYEYTGQLQGRALHWYARAVAATPHVYLITATALDSSWPAQKAMLVRSVESFRIHGK